MRLLPKITLINILSIVVTVCLFFVVAVFYYYMQFNISIREYYSTRHTIYKNFLSLKDANEIEKIGNYDFDEDLYFLIVDKSDRKIVYCSNKYLENEFLTDDIVHSEISLLNKLTSNKFPKGENFIMESLVNEDANLLLLFFAIKQINKHHYHFNPYLIIFLILGSGSFIFTIFSVFALQNTGQNIRNLEKSFEQISLGKEIGELKVAGSDEVSLLVHRFNLMYQELKETQSMRSRFLMGISHDLKTPLTTIDGYVNAILDGIIIDSEIPASIKKISNKLEILKQRIYELIDYMKMQTGQWYLSLSMVYLHPLLTELYERYQSDIQFSNRTIAMSLDIDKKLQTKVDKRLFERVMENLIENAIKYSIDNSTINISVYQSSQILSNRKNQNVYIKITNQSADFISQKECELLFEPFYRTSTSRNEPGFGLGLCIVKSIVDAHGWDIGVTSDEGSISFLITIPISF